jgi:hypothetical protein
MNIADAESDVQPTAGVESEADPNLALKVTHTYKFEAYDENENLKWQEEVPNLVVDEGLDDILDKYYKGSSYGASHFVGITGSSPSFASGDTMSTHGGWSEVTFYDEASRPSYDPGSVSSQSVDNANSKATFTISSNNTVIGGAFLTTDSTIGGTSGTLIGGASFNAGDKKLDDGDTLNVTVTATLTSA